MVDLAIRHRFTVDEFHRMGEAGILPEGDRLELINGEIVEMTPIGSSHAACVRDLDEWLQATLRGEAVVSAQQPLKVEYDGEPVPDVAVLRPRKDRYRQSHPTSADALLVIEVADSSVLFDRNVKSRMYARAGIPEYWVVDLPRSRVVVFLSPEGGEYAEQHEFGRGESWRSNGLGGREITVDLVLDGPGED
ncbi:Uma2 family endonuclease [Longimicrobium sp.]|uniref:Uma2 family endonuclease n=1 Tax=Longimicrobium sp. TaxID=2029185 RepID=UPI002CA44802|nr:Uma2 family endonuclease [Longimicrobium sp.]HSU15033.1 Uma2 family endonuclease [Longimicrobium sp.]